MIDKLLSLKYNSILKVHFKQMLIMITKLRNLVFITKYILIALGNMQPHQNFEDKIDVGTN